MKRSDLGFIALGGLAIASGCAPQTRASFDPPTGENTAAALPATTEPKLFAMTLHDLKIGTVMEFRVYHDRSATVTVNASPSDMTDITIVKKSRNLSHVSIKVIANGSSSLQVLSNDTEVLFFAISTTA